MGEPRSRTRYCGRCLTSFPMDPDVCPNLSCRTRRPEEGWGTIFETGEVIDRHYRVIKRLATGGAGVTYLAREVEPASTSEDLDLAVKVLWASRDHGSYLRRLSQEAQILQELAHPHIVEYRGFVHRTGSAPYLVTLFEHGGSLYDHVRRRQRLGLREVASVGRQVMEALGRAHQAGVIHRDLKPENVLLAQIPDAGQPPVVRVADFGIAKVQGLFSDGLTRMGAFVGTPQYAAPEQFDGLPPTPATDVFAAGAMLFFCLQGQPFLPLANRLPPEEARELLLQKLPPRLKLPDERPEQVKAVEQVLEAAMAPEPGERVTVREMHGMLEAIEEGTFLVRPAHTAVPSRSHTSDTNVFLFSQDGVELPDPEPTEHPGPVQTQTTELPRAEEPRPAGRAEQFVPPPMTPAVTEEQPPPPPTRPLPGPGPVDLPLKAKAPALAPTVEREPPPPPPSEPGPAAAPIPAPTPTPAPRPTPSPEPPTQRKGGRGFGIGLLLVGGLLLAVLCGGGGIGGLVWYRPDLLADIPGLSGLVTAPTGPAPLVPTTDRLRVQVEGLVDQGVASCDIRAAVHLGLTLAPDGRIAVEEITGVPVPRKAQCLREHLQGLALQPGPAEPLHLDLDNPGRMP
ncbi:MAG: serine/threonine-protein kinase [Pseudomonadota bacterium]